MAKAKAKKPTDIIPMMVRMREALRRKLERSADLHEQSINAEINWRLDRSIAHDEAIEEAAEEMSAREDQLQKWHEEWIKEQTRKEEEYKNALRDHRLLTMMVGDQDNVDLIKTLMYLINDNEGWNTSDDKRIELADKIHSFLISANDIFQGQVKK